MGQQCGAGGLVQGSGRQLTGRDLELGTHRPEAELIHAPSGLGAGLAASKWVTCHLGAALAHLAHVRSLVLSLEESSQLLERRGQSSPAFG